MMLRNRIRTNNRVDEVVFQAVLHCLLFFYHISGTQHSIALHDIVYFLNYAVAAWIINYILFPNFYYKKKYLIFALSVFLIINSVIVVEEVLLEKLFFPDNTGYRFPGYFNVFFEVFSPILLIVGAKFAWDFHTKQRELDNLKTEIKSSELQFLKSQINPHFLFNNLNNLYSYALEGSPKTTQIILELSSVLRYSLYECEDDYVLLQNEVEQLKNYVSLSGLQLEERGEVNFKVEQFKRPYIIAPLILFVFIENAFKHSLSSQTDNIKIKISLYVSDEGWLYFECSNTFSKQNETQNLPHGIGLSNVEKRLQLLYPSSHSLKTYIEHKIYNVALKLKLNEG